MDVPDFVILALVTRFTSTVSTWSNALLGLGMTEVGLLVKTAQHQIRQVVLSQQRQFRTAFVRPDTFETQPVDCVTHVNAAHTSPIRVTLLVIHVPKTVPQHSQARFLQKVVCVLSGMVGMVLVVYCVRGVRSSFLATFPVLPVLCIVRYNPELNTTRPSVVVMLATPVPGHLLAPHVLRENTRIQFQTVLAHPVEHTPRPLLPQKI